MQDNTLTEDQKRQLALEMGMPSGGEAPRPFDFDAQTEERQVQILGWEAIAEEAANGDLHNSESVVEEVQTIEAQPAEPQQIEEDPVINQSLINEAVLEAEHQLTSVEQTDELTTEQPSEAETLDIAMRKAAAINAGDATTREFMMDDIRNDYGDKYGDAVSSMELTDDQKAVQDRAVNQLSRVDTSNVTAVNAVLGGNYNGDFSNFGQVTQANAIGIMMQKTKSDTAPQTTSTVDTSIDIAQSAVATGLAGYSSDGKVAQQVEAVKSLTAEADGTVEHTADHDHSMAENALNNIDRLQNKGMDLDGTASDDNEKTVDKTLKLVN
ncbi:MAG: hypothetical protein Q4C83_00425 [Candidatus Saccharibacteria bacterium]|nr:hypothetical protein [Candidatus Saccharibacteria bacterium]